MTQAALQPSRWQLSLDGARSALAEVFGYHSFREGQQEVIASVLAGADTLAVMPTGGGKSLCYQVPALLFDSGVTVVVSPLLALMKDQVDALRAAGVAAAAINSTVSKDEQAATLDGVARGDIRLLYVAPERFGAYGFTEGLRQRASVSVLAIDEAHCVSQWGHDFRPSYRDLARVRERLGNPPMVALTATADPLVRDDIISQLGLRSPAVHVAGFDRPNLHLAVVRAGSLKQKAELIAEQLRGLGDQSAIIYCGTRKRVENLSESLHRAGIRNARYHAGMDADDRRRIQEAFQRDSLRVIVATNAFGLGIDKPDVRLVLHHDLPESLEAYYQEAGRAGRDGLPATCVLFYSARDRSLREFFIDLSHPDPDTVVDVYRALERTNGAVHIRELMSTDDEPGINAAVAALVESGLAERRGYNVKLARHGAESEIDLAGLEAHRAHALKKLDQMQAYAESMSCLRVRILQYFEPGDWEPCGNCGPCAAGPQEQLQQAADAESEDLFQKLRELRRTIADEAGVPPYVVFSDATLREMAAQRPRNRVEMLAVSGVGQVKWERYGMQFLSIVREAAGAEPVREAPVPVANRDSPASTLDQTLAFVRQGMSIAMIGKARGLATSTIAGHIETLVTRGAIDDITPWVDTATLRRIQQAAGEGRISALGPLREALAEDVGFEELRIARAWLNRR